MRRVLVLAMLLGGAGAGARADTTTRAAVPSLTVARGGARPVAVSVRTAAASVSRGLTPCRLGLEITTRHAVFEKLAIAVPFAATGSGGIAASHNSTLAIATVAHHPGTVVSKTGDVKIVPRGSQAFDVQLAFTFEADGAVWTFAGTARIDEAPCLWDVD